MPPIPLTADEEISKPLRLKSRDILQGNGYRLTPKPGYTGAAIEIEGDSFAKIQDLHLQGFNVGISVKGMVNHAIINDTFIFDCEIGVQSVSAWDTSCNNLTIQRCVNGLLLQGSDNRPSVPTQFYGLHVESFRQSAVVVSKAHNITFHDCKFHGQQGNEPDNHTILCTDKNYPNMLFDCGTKFYFNRSKHFDMRNKPAVELDRCWYDRIEDMGNVTMNNCKKTWRN